MSCCCEFPIVKKFCTNWTYKLMVYPQYFFNVIMSQSLCSQYFYNNLVEFLKLFINIFKLLAGFKF